MIDFTPLLRLYAGFRRRRLAHQDAAAVQQQTLMKLLRRAAQTRFGRDHRFADLRSRQDFTAAVPLRRYEQFWSEYWQPDFPRLLDCSWPGCIPYFASSSGTSSGTTKFIPVSHDMLLSNRRAGLDVVTHHLAARRDSRVGDGRHLLLGGSTALVERAPGIGSGDLSGIASGTAPFWMQPFAFPPAEIGRLTDWTEKMARLARLAPTADIRSLSGTPSWLLLFFDELARQHPGREPRLASFFPNLELLVHGGVNFAPYRHRFTEWLAGSRAETREVYAASEGFVAVADCGDGEGMRLIADHGVFYEFVPVGEIDAVHPTRHWLGNIEPGIDYAIVLTTCAGLWAYIVGDTVRFIERETPRLLVTGRLSYTLSAFGEHLTGEEIEAAATKAAMAIGIGLRDFAAGALYPERVGEIGGHLYVVEFEAPVTAEQRVRFATALDEGLARRNLDYRDHRAGGFGMRPPEIRVLRGGGFAEWMRRRGRLGAQHKVPRVINDPELFADLRAFAAANDAC
jgi:hypothetical protein